MVRIRESIRIRTVSCFTSIAGRMYTTGSPGIHTYWLRGLLRISGVLRGAPAAPREKAGPLARRTGTNKGHDERTVQAIRTAKHGKGLYKAGVELRQKSRVGYKSVIWCVLYIYNRITLYNCMYIYIPRTHLTPVLIGKDHVLAPKQGSIRF